MDFDQNCDCKNCAIAERDHLRAAAKEAAEHLRNEAAELKKAHTVSGEWDGTEPDAMDECERLIALANRLQTNAPEFTGCAAVRCKERLGVNMWKPIVTAPKDGSFVLICDTEDPSELMIIARWRFVAWWSKPTPSGTSIVWMDATHWMPLPEMPNA